MRYLSQLFDRNRAWAGRMNNEKPRLFELLDQQQNAKYFWIGCADSRVPSTQITDTLPGEMFVHRNVANQAHHTDMNLLSCLQYAVDVLGVKHIIVCGHYGCGGILATMRGQQVGIANNWLLNAREQINRHLKDYPCDDMNAFLDRACEVNVIEQVFNVGHTTVISSAWARGQAVHLHGWIYRIGDGLLRDLEMCASSEPELQELYHQALNRVMNTPVK